MASKDKGGRETDKFVGCILSVKTKPGPFGEVQNIIGTVRDLDVNCNEQAIILDDAMSNGKMLTDGYVLLSSQIADLTVIGRAEDLEVGSSSSREDVSPPPQPLTACFDKNPVVTSSQQQHRVHNDLGRKSNSSSCSSSPDATGLGFKDINVIKGQKSRPGGSILLNTSSTANSVTTGPLAVSSALHHPSHKIAKPKPRKPQPGLVYSANSVVATNIENEFIGHNGGKSKANKVSVGSLFSNGEAKTTKYASNATNNISKSYKEVSKRASAPQVRVNTNNDIPKENILTQTFGMMMATPSSMAGSLPLNGDSLFNTLTMASAAAAVTNDLCLSSGNIHFQPEAKGLPKVTAPNHQKYDDKKLGALSQFLSGSISQTTVINSPIDSSAAFAKSLPTINSKVKGAFGRQQKFGDNGETFGMAKSEMTKDFDFEESNAQFEKLPVSAARPVKTVKDPHFTCEDTTHKAERLVESVRIKGNSKTKTFVTDTGVAIPAVDLSTRSMILNLAHDLGLTHSRMIEAMARAVVQTSLPLLGDTYRLSPEREEDRPWVLVCAGPHWQGAVGIAVARILASLGVRTFVHSPKEEVQVCAVEEKLYKLTGEGFTRNFKEIGSKRFDLVVMAMNDHLTGSLSSLPSYSKWLVNASVVYVDPPLISSYREPLELLCGKGKSGAKIIVITPVLPLAYNPETSVKFYLVNLGIPNDIFLKNNVVYKSPFGDKMVIQMFSAKQGLTLTQQ